MITRAIGFVVTSPARRPSFSLRQAWAIVRTRQEARRNRVMIREMDPRLLVDAGIVTHEHDGDARRIYLRTY